MLLELPSKRKKQASKQERVLVTVRMARAFEGPLIHQLLDLGGWTEIPGLDWSASPVPYWLIAECVGTPIGCICINPGRPIGTMEFLAVDTVAPKRVRAIAVKQLCYAGLEALKTMGSQVAVSTVIERDQGWANVIERRGSVKWTPATIYLRRT